MATARGLEDHLTECAKRYDTTAQVLLRLGDKADQAALEAVKAASEARASVSDLERRLFRWFILLLLAVVGTALKDLIHLPTLHFGP